MEFPKPKFKLTLDVVETTEGKHSVHYTMNEYHPTMKEVGLALYKLKQIEQELIDRIWDNGGEGYEIISDDTDGQG